MIRALGAFVLALFAFACAPSYMKSTDGAFALLTSDGSPICSAFAIGEHEVMTAAHCVRDEDAEFALVSKELWDRTAKGSASLTVVYRDDDRDLALLHTPLAFGSFLRIRAPRESETVNAFSAFGGWRSSPGRVYPGFGFFRDTDVTVQHGWSGSPVLGSDGFAVGVVSRCYGHYVNSQHVCNPNDMQFSALP